MPAGNDVADAYLWLEEVEGERALGWVRERNRHSTHILEAEPGFEELRRDLLTILDSSERIPMVTKRGDHLYNFWQDAAHPRGIWRRTTLESYRGPSPHWEILLDIDALNAEEDENWVWHGATFLEPADGQPYARCLVALSRGGADADETREFDVLEASFVEDGFYRPEAKGELAWIDHDRVYVATDFGPGSLTDSGYPRVVKEWHRGAPMEDATTVYEGLATDLGIWAYHDQTPGFERDLVLRKIAFYRDEWFLRTDDGLTKIDVPDSVEKQIHRDWLVLTLREPWTVEDRTYAAGALLATRLDAFMSGERSFEVAFEPDEHTSLVAALWTKHHLLLNVLRDVRNEISVLTPGEGGWERTQLEGAPEMGTVVAEPADPRHTDEYMMTATDFLTPTTLLLGEVGAAPERLKSLPAFFDADGLEVEQRFATSADGTRVPYFVVAPTQVEGPIPTLLTGYGGFEIPMLPQYMATVGRGWLEAGRALVVANIRGGGEYGPRWHQAALRENRPRAYEDFVAVADGIVTSGLTTRRLLACQGGSNGGLLVGNMLASYPERFGAVVCQVPLLDMRRYHELLAGASWMAEYGDPDDPDDWAFIQGFSPYHNVAADRDYPPVLFTTSTRDDRVHPGHARKMVAKMTDHGHDVLYWENIEGGHGGAADNDQLAYMFALEYTFLERVLGSGRVDDQDRAGGVVGDLVRDAAEHEAL